MPAALPKHKRQSRRRVRLDITLSCRGRFKALSYSGERVDKPPCPGGGHESCAALTAARLHLRVSSAVSCKQKRAVLVHTGKERCGIRGGTARA